MRWHLSILAIALGCAGSDAGESEQLPAPEPGETEQPGEEPDDEDGIEPPAPEGLRIMTYNIKAGRESSLDELAATIRAEKVDVALLQEVDREAERTGFVDQPYRLGQLTGMAASFRSSRTLGEDGYYGLAVLSRFPIISSTKTLLDSEGEQRIVVVWRLTLDDGSDFYVANTHLATNDTDRQAQVPQIAEVLIDEQPDVLVGDFNLEAGDPLFDHIVDEGYVDGFAEAGVGAGESFPADTPSRRIDLIFAAPGWNASRAYVAESVASDHRPVVADLHLTPPE